MPATDFGFVLDITNLDNSFNMIINGTQLAKQEIQFQKVQERKQLVFQDGSKYEEGGIPEYGQMGEVPTYSKNSYKQNRSGFYVWCLKPRMEELNFIHLS